MFLAFSGVSLGQDVQKSEQQFSALQAQIEQEQLQLDSLNAALEQKAGEIDREKRRENPDKSHLRRLMSEGLSLTEQVNFQQQQLSVLRENSRQLQQQLAQSYSAILDSLQQLEKSGKYRGDRQQLREEIIVYTEKYLLFSPSFKALSFDPHKIRQINLAEEQDSLGRAISIDYLQQARADVDLHLTHIKKNREELENIVRLEQKTSEFLEEAEDEQFSVFARGNNGNAATDASVNENQGLSPFETRSWGLNSVEQLQSIVFFFDQLNIDPSDKVVLTWHSPVDSTRVEVSLEEYLLLLKEAEKRLEQYHSVISNKLGEDRSH